MLVYKLIMYIFVMNIKTKTKIMMTTQEIENFLIKVENEIESYTYWLTDQKLDSDQIKRYTLKLVRYSTIKENLLLLIK